MSTTILIWTQPGDAHAIAVERVLRQRGYFVHRLFSSDIPTRATLSFSVSDEGEKDTILTDQLGLEIKPDAVWLRRAARPILGSHLVGEEAAAASAECGALVQELWLATGNSARWVNNYDGFLRAESKSLQLQLAVEIGLAIPKTLISNSPNDIRDFVSKSEAPVIYKPFIPDRWADEDGKPARMRTVTVTSEDLPVPDLLRRSPGIFQIYIRKAYEVRATFFGDYEFSVRLDPPTGQAPTDIKMVSPWALRTERVWMPSETQHHCKRLMRALGIVFASFDFAVTEDGWIFLELNQTGQFLWLERINPRLALLSTAAQYFQNLTSGRVFQPQEDGVHLAEVLPLAESKELARKEVAIHPSYYPPPSRY